MPPCVAAHAGESRALEQEEGQKSPPQRAVAEPAPTRRELPQRRPHRILAALALIPARRAGNPERVTRSALAHAEPVLDEAHGQTACGGHHHFFATTACSI